MSEKTLQTEYRSCTESCRKCRADAEEEWQLQLRPLLGHADGNDVGEYTNGKKGSAWWNHEVKDVIQTERVVYKAEKVVAFIALFIASSHRMIIVKKGLVE